MANYASSIGGTALRVTRLSATGAPLVGVKNSYVQTSSFISLSFTPEYEDGDEFSQKGANGEVCTTFKMPDTLKRVNFELAVCDPDPEFTELLSGGALLADGADTVGYAAPASGVDANPNGVALEVWSNAIVGGKRDGLLPYWRWVFPYVQMRPSGDRVIANEILANTYEGWGVGNLAFGEGPVNDWEFPTFTDRAYAYARTDAAPSGRGYQAVTAP